MKIIKKGEGVTLNTPQEFVAQKLFSNEKTEIIRIKFKEKGYFKKHYAPTDLWIYVLKGEGVLEGDKNNSIKFSKDDFMYSPSGNPHKIVNTGKGELEILVIKIPRSDKPVVFLE